MKDEELPRDDLSSEVKDDEEEGGLLIGTADGGELKSLLLEPIKKYSMQ
jgi:hypothetical protein